MLRCSLSSAKIQKKIETTIPFNSIFLFSTQRLSIREPPNYLPTEPTEHRNDRWGISSHRLHRFSQIRRVWHPAIPTQPPNYLPTEFTEHTETSGAIYSPTDCTDAHRLGGYGIPAIPTQPQNYLPTEFTEHTETTGGEEKSVYICEIRGRLLSARRFCGFCVFRGRFLSEAMLVQRRPLHPRVLLQAFHLFYWQA